MSDEEADLNINSIEQQLETLFENVREYAKSHGYKTEYFGKVDIVDNHSWWQNVLFSDFLNDVARYMRLGPMIARERCLTP